MASVFTIDAHAGGEPCRTIVAGLPALRGGTVAERRDYFRDRFDWVRTALMHEPRGHAGMFGSFILSPDRPSSEFALFFFDPVGYLDGCGHGTMCSVAVWRRMVGETGLPFTIDNPDGSLTRVIGAEGNESCRVTLEMPPATVLQEHVDLPGFAGVDAGVAKCGNIYLAVRASEAGLPDLPSATPQQIRNVGTAVRQAAQRVLGLPEGAGLEVALYEPLPDKETTFATAILFSQTQIDRCPCGTGSSSLLSLFLARGEAEFGQPIRTVGPVGEAFEAVAPADPAAAGEHYRIQLTGHAHLTGVNEWILADGDPIRAGYRFE